MTLRNIPAAEVQHQQKGQSAREREKTWTRKRRKETTQPTKRERERARNTFHDGISSPLLRFLALLVFNKETQKRQNLKKIPDFSAKKCSKPFFFLWISVK